MAISNVIEKLGRVIFEAPFGTDRLSRDSPELAEIRLAVLDAVKAKSHRANGRNVFPYDLVRIHLLGVPEDQSAVFRGDFLARYFSDELKEGLRRSSYRFPENLTAEITTSPSLPDSGQDWLVVETANREQHPEPRVRGFRAAKVIVIEGKANHPEMLLDKPRTNIGRTAEVYRQSGPSRRNDLAFTEDTETNRTVSREHAHILRSTKTGEYRLFNDRTYKGAGNCGLWIVRDGLSQPVHRSARGTVLKAGDDIHLGSAVIRFQCR